MSFGFKSVSGGASKSLPRSRAVVAAAMAAASLVSGRSAFAASASWLASPGDSNWIPGTGLTDWSTGANTFPGSTSVLTSADVATFNVASSQKIITLNSPTLNVGQVVFDSSASAYTIGSAGASGGNSLLLSNASSASVTLGSTATSFTGTGVTETFNAPVVLEPTSSASLGYGYFTNNSTTASNVLNFAGNISGGTTSFANAADGAGGGGSIVLTLGGANTGNNVISGIIGDGGAGTAGLSTNNTGGTASGALQLGVAVNKTGAGTWYLTGNNTFSGQLGIFGGILNVASISNYGAASAIGDRPVGIDNAEHDGVGLLLFGGTLQYTGSTAQSSNRQIRLGDATDTLDASGSTPAATMSFTFSGAPVSLFSTAGARTLVLTGTNTGNNLFSEPLYNQGSNATNLTKTGTGTWVDAATNGYTGTAAGGFGTMTIASGTLILTGNNANITGTGGAQIHLDNNAFLQLQANSGNINTSVVNASSGFPTSYALSNTSGANSFYFSDGNGGAATLQLRSDTNVAFAGTTTGGNTGSTTLNFDVNSITGATGVTLAVGAIGTYNTTMNATGGNGCSFELGGVSANYGSTLTLNAVTAPFIVGSTGIVGIAALNISASATAPFTVNGVITPNTAGGGTLLKTGAGTLTLNGNNTFGGNITVQAGNLAVSTINAIGAAGPLGEGGTVTLGGAATTGTFEYSGTANVASTRTFTLATGGGGFQVDVASTTLTHTGTFTGSGPFYKSGPGTLVLSGTYNNTGAMNVVGGTLNLSSGVNVSAPSGFNVGSGATLDISADSGFALGSTQTLSGLGMVNGPYTHTTGLLAAGTTTTTGTLTFNSGLTLAGGNLGVGIIAATNAADLVTANTQLTIAAPTSVTLSFVGTPAVGSTYEILSYPVGSLTGSVSQLSATNRGVSFTNNAALGEIFATYNGYANLVWTGANGSNWDVQTTKNWYNPALPGPDYFYQSDAVTFDDTNTSGNTGINLTTVLTPTSVLVNSSSNAYSFTGSGSIGGIATLTKAGSSILTVSTANPYSGDTNLGAGSIVVTNSTGAALGTGNLNMASGTALTVGQGGAGALGNSTVNAGGTVVVASSTLSALGTGPLTIASTGSLNLSSPSTTGTIGNSAVTDNGTIIFSSSTYISLNATAISGTGTLQVAGPASISLGPDTYQGGTFITGGTVDPNSSTCFGTGTVTVNGGDIYSTVGVFTYANNFIFNGFSFESGGARVETINGSVTLASNAGANADGGSTLIFNGPITQASAGLNPTFTVGGSGTLEFGGSINLGSGQLSIASTANLIPATATTMTISSVVTGTGGITLAGPGNAVLSANNTFVGGVTVNGGILTLSGSNTYTGATNINNGAELLISNSGALGATSLVTIAGGGGVTGYLGLTGNINSPAPILFQGRSGTSAASPQVLNISGNNILTGPLSSTTFGNEYIVESDSGTLTLTGAFNPAAGGGNRYLNLQGPAVGYFNGVIANGTTANGGAVINLNVNGPGTWTLGAVNTYTGATVVYGGTLIFGAQNGSSPTLVSLPGGLNVASGATVALQSPSAAAGPAGRQILSTPALITTTTSGIDLGANDLDLSGTVTVNGTLATSNLTAVTALVAQGYNLTGGANWQGSGGITSTAAAADSKHLTALGVIQNNQNGTQLYGNGVTFDGTNPGASDILVKYTYFGDANLDGKVDGSDYTLIDAGYASGGTLTGWLNGDFNYDGVIDGSDYALIDNAFNNQNQTVGASALVAAETAQVAGAGSAAPASAVPEPASVGLIIAAAAGLVGRRRKI